MLVTLARLALVAFVIALQAGCSSAPPPPVTPAPQQADIAAGEFVLTTADGSQMPYTVAGDGPATIVLVHCWMCDRSFWSAQVPVLAQRYRTVAMDLPGHGRASRGRTSWTVAGYGEDVAALISELELSNVVLVGHSMGGPVALKAAALSKGRVRGILAVDSLHDAEFEFKGDQVDGFLRAFEADFAGTCSSFVDQMFPETGVDAIKAHVRDTGCNPERSAIGTALLRNFGAIEMEQWFSEAGVPIRAINSGASNPTKVTSNRKYADFDAITMPAVGHYPHMTRPEEFNKLLLQALSEMLR